MTNSNTCAKTRPKSDPYESWEVPGIGTFHVLKKYKSPKGEAADPFAGFDDSDAEDEEEVDLTGFDRRKSP